MIERNKFGLFKVIAQRTTVRNEAGAFFIGSLLAGDYFYVGHIHPRDSHWVWGFGGIHFNNFGWVRLESRLVRENNRKSIEEKYAKRVQDFLKHGGHKNRKIEHFAKSPLPLIGSTAATRHVNIVNSVSFYLNHSHGVGKNSGVAGIPAILEPGKKLSWRYLTKDNMHCVVYHPLGYPLKGHGKWGFIKNDANGIIDPQL